MDPLVQAVAAHVRQQCDGEASGHDWWHIQRVWNLAKLIGSKEGADMAIVELGALLHDIADWKFHGGDDTVGPKVAREVLVKFGAPAATIDHVSDIVATISYKGAGVPTPMRTLEGKVVQDADRLDAIGAIGIARTFIYTGHKGRLMHDPNLKPELHNSKEAYFKGGQTTINHFYEKLLLLKDRMNTDTARALADGRHRFMETYLDQFYKEWDADA